MKYPSYEARYPRAVFTKKLQAIAEKLSACSTKDIPYAKQRFSRNGGVETVTITAMWVVGSYARGSQTCGDLDLVIEAKIIRCPEGSVLKAMTGTPRDVRFYIGTPKENSSHVKFPEAKLVWAPGLDWRAAIGSIKEVEGDLRFERATDAIPFRAEQLLGMRFDQRDDLMKARKKGLIEWEFVPFDQLKDQPYVNEKVARWAAYKLGKERTALLPYIQGYLSSSPLAHYSDNDLTDGVWTSAGVQVHLGRCTSLKWQDLNTPKISEVVFMPFLNTRGPNGLWVIRRGENHPLRKNQDGLRGWVELCEGRPGISEYMGEHHQSANVLRVFSSQQAFQEYVESYCDDEDVPGELVHLEGAALLAALAGTDALEVWEGYEDDSERSQIYYWSAERMLGDEWGGEDVRGKNMAQHLVEALA